MPFYMLSLRLYNEQLKNIYKSLIKFILETINAAETISLSNIQYEINCIR